MKFIFHFSSVLPNVFVFFYGTLEFDKMQQNIHATFDYFVKELKICELIARLLGPGSNAYIFVSMVIGELHMQYYLV